MRFDSLFRKIPLGQTSKEGLGEQRGRPYGVAGKCRRQLSEEPEGSETPARRPARGSQLLLSIRYSHSLACLFPRVQGRRTCFLPCHPEPSSCGSLGFWPQSLEDPEQPHPLSPLPAVGSFPQCSPLPPSYSQLLTSLLCPEPSVIWPDAIAHSVIRKKSNKKKYSSVSPPSSLTFPQALILNKGRSPSRTLHLLTLFLRQLLISHTSQLKTQSEVLSSLLMAAVTGWDSVSL